MAFNFLSQLVNGLTNIGEGDQGSPIDDVGEKNGVMLNLMERKTRKLE